ncbi:MAG: hypothetical protein SNH63_02785 [Rikenellaceae bacterium]
MKKSRQNTASIKRTASEATEALITAKCAISDLHGLILNAVEDVYGESQSDRCNDEIAEHLHPLQTLIDRYIIEAISENIISLDSTTF